MRSKGQDAERRVLKKIKARPQPNSGAIPGMPHDGIRGRWMIEVKSTEKKSLGVKREWLIELEGNAINHIKHPAMILLFEGCQPWVLVPLDDFEKLSLGWRAR